MRATFTLVLLAAMCAACSGSTLLYEVADQAPDGAADGTSDASAADRADDVAAAPDAGEAASAAVDGACPARVHGAELGAPCLPEGDGLIEGGTLPDGGATPAHRATGACCPTERGPGRFSPCPFSETFPACSCTGDGDCSLGVNGRCLNSDDDPFPGCDPPSCSYDECFSDSDCGGNVPCQCRAPGLASGAPANQCLVGSNCRVDSDCGPGGLCSPTYAALTTAAQICAPFYGPEAFFCHTPQDGCVVDSDCSGALLCGFDAPQQRWACISVCEPPP